MPVSRTDPNGDTQGSDPNQAALEERFQEMYTQMMEKKVQFKEATEPFKTDNENASKG